MLRTLNAASVKGVVSLEGYSPETLTIMISPVCEYILAFVFKSHATAHLHIASQLESILKANRHMNIKCVSVDQWGDE